ncbi:MAG: sulfotransferase family 2 domain-containing protein [Acidimicrobiales bacterium]|nr:sulfotransferase family 2 domain-containing protein [Acidimicrobiales bacterium]
MTRQIFYTHVMKTGGTSIGRVLQSCFTATEVFPRDEGEQTMVASKTFSHVLRELGADERAALRLISVHQPAWVAFAVAPDAFKLTVLREPVARTISHLRQVRHAPDTPDDIEEIYADEGWRSRLTNYQTQLFADTEARELAAAGAVDVEAMDESGRAQLAADLSKFWRTGISRPMTVGPAELDAAKATLARYDCVGVTSDLPAVVQRVAARTGLELRAVPHANVGDPASAVPPALIEQINADTEYDRRLYEHAVELAGATG